MAALLRSTKPVRSSRGTSFPRFGTKQLWQQCRGCFFLTIPKQIRLSGCILDIRVEYPGILKVMLMQRFLLLVLGFGFIGLGGFGFVSDPIFGMLDVDPLHNIVHILSGLLALAAVMLGNGTMRMFARIGGAVYLAIALAGFFMPMQHIFGLFIANTPDHWLHLGIAALLFWIGFSGRNHPELTDEPGNTDMSTPV